MKKYLFLFLTLASICFAQSASNPPFSVNSPLNGQLLQYNSTTGYWQNATISTGGTVTSVTGGSSGGVSVVFQNTTTTPSISSITLGAIAPTTVNGLTISTTAGGILTISNAKQLTVTNSLTFAGIDGSTLTFQNTGTVVNRDSTDTLTNKTFNTTGTGNDFQISGTQLNDLTGGSLTIASGGHLQLSGDTASPGNSYFYGTDSSGVKGWYVQSSSGVVDSIIGTANEIAASSATGNVTLSLVGPHGFSTQTAHGVILGEGTSALAASAAGTSGQPFISGGSSADGAYGALNLAGGSSLVTGTLPVGNGGTGSASAPTSGQLPIGNAGGTAYAPQTLAGDVASLSATGNLVLGKVNGVSYGSGPSTNTVPVVTGSNTTTYETVPNAALANSSITLGSTSIALGATSTTPAGLTSIGVNSVSSASGSALSLAGGDATHGIISTGFGATNAATSGTQTSFSLTPTYNQASGTATNYDLLVNRTETAVGSGTQRLLSLQVGSTEKFGVDDTGIVKSGTWQGSSISAAYLNVANSIINNSGNLSLSGDSASPGNNYFYGTSAGGSKGFFPLASSAVTAISGTPNQITASATTGSVTLSLPSAITLPGTINKLTLTAPATGSTLTIADGKTLTSNISATFSGSDNTITLNGSPTLSGLTTIGSGTLALGTKNLTVSNSLTLAGTDSTTMTFPSTSATIARTDAGQTFTGTQVIGGISFAATNAITGGAGNMTIISGTGNSRTMTLESTTSGGTATAFLTGNADQSVTFNGAVSGVTTLATSNRITVTSSNGLFLDSNGPTTGDNYIEMANTGSTTDIGSESSAGGAIFTGSTAYATVLGNLNNVPVQIGVNSSIVGTFTSTGINSTAIGTTTASTGKFTTLSSSLSSASPGTAVTILAPSISDGGFFNSTFIGKAASSFNSLGIGFFSSSSGSSSNYGYFALNGESIELEVFSDHLTIPSGGLVVGSATGGSLGTGTINVSSGIYLNNTAYTNPDFVLEKWATGKIVKFADKKGAKGYSLLSLPEMEAYSRKHLALPGFGQDAKNDLFSGSENLLARTEEAYIHLFDHEHRLDALESCSSVSDPQTRIISITALLISMYAAIIGTLAYLKKK